MSCSYVRLVPPGLCGVAATDQRRPRLRLSLGRDMDALFPSAQHRFRGLAVRRIESVASTTNSQIGQRSELQSAKPRPERSLRCVRSASDYLLKGHNVRPSYRRPCGRKSVSAGCKMQSRLSTGEQCLQQEQLPLVRLVCRLCSVYAS